MTIDTDLRYLKAAKIANGVELCMECELGDHEQGFMTAVEEVDGDWSQAHVHLRRERVTKAALRRLWELAWYANIPEPVTLTDWEDLYFKNRFIWACAKQMKVRLPRSLADHDRARTRELLAKEPHSQRDDLYRVVYRWARR